MPKRDHDLIRNKAWASALVSMAVGVAAVALGAVAAPSEAMGRQEKLVSLI